MRASRDGGAATGASGGDVGASPAGVHGPPLQSSPDGPRATPHRPTGTRRPLASSTAPTAVGLPPLAVDGPSGAPLFALPITDAVAVAVGAVLFATVVVGALDRLSGGSVRTRLADTPLGGSSSVVPPVSALSEEEQFVVELLREHGGQVRQSTIVDASEWSKSKVSRLLSSMEAEGYVEKRTVGRENVISLPGEGDRA